MNKKVNLKTNVRLLCKCKLSTRCLTGLLCLLLNLSLSTSLAAQAEPLDVTITANPLSCNGDSDGQLTFRIEGGTSPYHYTWSTMGNPFVFAQGNVFLPNEEITVGGTLTAATYLLRTEDAAGNERTDTFVLAEPPAIQVMAIDVGNSNCATNCDGYIAMDVGGGSGVLTTFWNDTSVPGTNRTGLCAGSYVFVISDENACTQKGVLDIEAPAALALETELSLPTCLGADNGQISVVASGGAGEYGFSWSTGEQGANLAGLAAGNYQVSLTDANGCHASANYTLPDGPLLAPNVQVNYGCGDGAIVVSTQPLNGSAPYTYQWSTGQASAVIYAISAGDYSLDMQDANGCAATVDFTVNYVEPLAVNVSVVPVSCYDAADGQINLNISGGQPPFDIWWSNGANSSEINALPGGEYLYNLSSNGCGTAQLVNVPEPGEITAEVIFQEGNNNTLSATALISGGQAPYQIDWSTGSMGNTAYNLQAETTYTIWVEDAQQCTASFEVVARLTGTEEWLNRDLFKLYPNPTPGLIWLTDVSYYLAATPYQLFNGNGQTLLKGQLASAGNTLLDLSAFPAGIYYLRLLVEGESVLMKVFKI